MDILKTQAIIAASEFLVAIAGCFLALTSTGVAQAFAILPIVAGLYCGYKTLDNMWERKPPEKKDTMESTELIVPVPLEKE